MPLLKEGQKLRETYHVERFLGEGAFAEVYRVQHRFLGRQAMKVLKTPGMTLNEIEQMLGEALLLSKMGHPNIVRVFDANLLDLPSGGYGFFTMEYVPGGSLESYWRSYNQRFMPVQEVVSIVRQICAGISIGHSESPPIVHRDIKPQNVLIGYDGAGMRVRVSDFGLAKSVNPLTLLASSRGTLSFKPPESLYNQDSCTADVWAIGTTMYLLLTDKLPYPGLDERDLLDANRFLKPYRPAGLYNIEVDATLDAIISRCLAPEAPSRYGDAKLLLNDLSRWFPGETVQALSNVVPSTTLKDAFGTRTPADNAAVSEAIKYAIALSKEPGRLGVAAEILEEAINKDPAMRNRYESQLILWRRGISM
jgi:serine/threonine-protein kinase